MTLVFCGALAGGSVALVDLFYYGLEPSRTYSSPSRRAVVRMDAESEPEPASVSA
jgi:hypothetical protein